MRVDLIPLNRQTHSIIRGLVACICAPLTSGGSLGSELATVFVQSQFLTEKHGFKLQVPKYFIPLARRRTPGQGGLILSLEVA